MKSRNANYKLLEVNKLFVPAIGAGDVQTSGNIKNIVEPPPKTISDFDNYYNNSFGGLVSAPMALSRLIALFEGIQIETFGQSGYKITWNIALVHPETGYILTFYDYKGGISYGSSADPSDKVRMKAFVRDVKKLLKVLKDERCPHPYDGCAVGEVA